MKYFSSSCVALVSTLFLLLITFTPTTTRAQTPTTFKCSSTSSCQALVDYVPINSTTYSDIKTLFGVENIHSIFGANSLPLSTSPNETVPAKQHIKIPFPCICNNGTGISNNRPLYSVKEGDSLDFIARTIFSNLVTYQQIATVNRIRDPITMMAGLTELLIPLPCSCDEVDGMQVVHYGHLVRNGSSVQAIADEYGTTQSTLLRLNGLASANDLLADSVIDVPLQGESRNSSKVVVIIVVPTVVVSVVFLSIVTIYFCFRRKNGNKSIEKVNEEEEIGSVESLQFKFRTIQEATNNFSDTNKLGKGGFGIVYKGVLSNGQEIAVKRLSRNSAQGIKEFKNEVLLVVKLQHRNLVKLLGFCLEGDEKLLIYEFAPNGSLNHCIFDSIKSTCLDWEKRYMIIGGIARGLLYLHVDSRLRIIHRDLKVGNILLDAQMEPKISDFGMARLFEVDQIEDTTGRIVGTYGYMAPEYAMHGQFSAVAEPGI